MEGNGAGGSGGNYRSIPLDESKKDFWDSFADAGSARQGGGGGSAIGTGAVKKNGAGMGGGAAKGKVDDGDWDKW